MDSLPDDATARQEWLERWAGEQQQRLASEQRLAERRISRRLAQVPTQARQALVHPDSLLERAVVARLLDRGLHTSDMAFEPEHEHPERVGYLPSAWHVLPRALWYLGVSDRDTFVDFGCGKGVLSITPLDGRLAE
jgi:hypothetical protein